MIPEPDYSDDEAHSDPPSPPPTNEKVLQVNNRVIQNGNGPQLEKAINGSRIDENGLILPKKVGNPCMESPGKKNLHRELVFNHKVGINVLNQKSELQKAMERHKDKKVLKEQEKEKSEQLTPLQKAIDERANRIEKLQKEDENEKSEVMTSSSLEFQRLQARLVSKADSK